MNFLGFRHLRIYALYVIATGLLDGCQHECTGLDVPEVREVSIIRGDLACPSVEAAQAQADEDRDMEKVISSAGTTVTFKARQIVGTE